MPAKRIVACLDVRGGRVVKGTQFEALRDAGEPSALAARYCTEGIDELVMLDVSATLDERLATRATIDAVARVSTVPLTVGGGVRSVDDIARLLDAGADKVAINSAAYDDPALLTRAAERFGSQCIVLAIDARPSGDGYAVASHSAQRPRGLDAIAWAREGETRGAGEVLMTSIDRDGVGGGFDTALIASLAASLRIPVIASGGARDASSFVDAFASGADAALGASIFHFNRAGIGEIKAACADAGLEIRP